MYKINLLLLLIVPIGGIMEQTALGKRIRFERKKLNLTQEQLAELINVSTTYIGLVERGERSLTLSKLVQVANSLGVSVDYLLTDSISENTSSQEKLLLQLFASATDEEKKLILEMAKLIIKNKNDNEKDSVSQ